LYLLAHSTSLATSGGKERKKNEIEKVLLWLSLFVPKTYTPFFHLELFQTKKGSHAFVMG
tara:strand:+ start:355 stop:534 length:180 start_codon:yes stop_codon:yes gene_type:complete